MTANAPRELGGFVLLERIGQGGMGEVWRAVREGPGSIRRRAAVKRILPEQQGNAVLRERFLAEARITARLEHPNIVQVIDFGDQPELYLVLEYINGLSLHDLMRRAAAGRGVLPVAATLFILAEAATGLDYAHRRTDEQGNPLGIVHRDVSPPNILVSVDGAVKVSDFGVARAADNSLRTQAGVSLGKLVYMSPEQATGMPLDRRADIYSLGITLWEALCLRPLIPRDSPADALAALQRSQFPPPSSLVRGLPTAVDDIVREALAHDREARTASGARMARALRAVLHTISPGFDSRDLGLVVLQLAPELVATAPAEPLTPAGHPAPPVAAAGSPVEPGATVNARRGAGLPAPSAAGPGAPTGTAPTGIAQVAAAAGGGPPQGGRRLAPPGYETAAIPFAPVQAPDAAPAVLAAAAAAVVPESPGHGSVRMGGTQVMDSSQLPPAMLDALRGPAQGPAVGAGPLTGLVSAPPVAPPRRRSRVGRVLLALFLVILVAAATAGGVIYFLANEGDDPPARFAGPDGAAPNAVGAPVAPLPADPVAPPPMPAASPVPQPSIDPAPPPVEPAAPPGGDLAVTTAQQTAITSLARAARACADRVGLAGVAGTALMDASFQANGYAASMLIRIRTGNDTDGNVAQCTETSMRRTPTGVTPAGYALQGIQVAF